MAASGVTVHDDVVVKWNEMKLRRTVKWMIFHIPDDKQIVVECTGSGGSDELLSKIPELDCRFAVYDNNSKIQFVLWCPDAAPVKPRMLYATSKDAITKKLDGISTTSIEAHSLAELQKELKETAR